MNALAKLTFIKCYRDWEVDEGSADTLTHIRGYSNNEHELVCQTRVSVPYSRPLPARSLPHKTRILDEDWPCAGIT